LFYPTLAVLLGNGVTKVPVHTSFAVISSSLVKTVETLTGSLIAAQWVTQVNISVALALLAATTRYHRIAPVANFTAVDQLHIFYYFSYQ
jgi:hypothetical protein